MVVLLLVSCDQHKMDGYSKTKTGLYYQIHSLGEGEVKAQNKDRVFADIQAFNENEELLFRNRLQAGNSFQFIMGSKKDGGLNEALSLMYEGDSASFIAQASSFDLKSLTRGKVDQAQGEVKLSIKLNRLEAQKKLDDSLKIDLEMQEWIKLEGYMKAFAKNEFSEIDGIYFSQLSPGKGNYIQSGQDIWINYRGYFLDSTEFDNTYKYKQALDFQLGKPDQVIKGFEIALHKMKQGGKARIIIPSILAFGEEGSSSGIVPPYTTVIYELEVMLVN